MTIKKYYRYLFLVVLVPLTIVICNEGYSQKPPLRTESKKAIRLYEEGLARYNMKDYNPAANYLLEAINTDPKFQNAYLVLAEVYWEKGSYKEAAKFYGKGLEIDPAFYPRGYYNKGNLEIKSGQYNEALKSFLRYLELEPGDPKYSNLARKGIKQSKFAINAVNNPVPFRPENPGPGINSPSDEYWPSLSADQQTLVITRLVEYYDIVMGKQYQEDFYFSKYVDGKWTQAVNAGSPLNTPDNEGAQSISANGKYMVYTVCNRRGVIGRCDLYFSELVNSQWSPAKNIGPPVNTAFKETQPSISSDANVIYFSSDRPGGKGKLDIWVSKKNENGEWGIPVNLGDSVNTPEDEMSPFIHHDNNTLYFSSNGHIGMGGADLFITKRNEKGKFDNVKNLGYPINTFGDEIGLIVNAKGNTAFYASNNEGNKDIYYFELYPEVRPVEVSYLKGQVYDARTGDRLKAAFELFNLKDGSPVSRSESEERTGEFVVCIPADNDYMLNVSRPGYLFYSDNFSLKGIFSIDKPFLKNIPLVPIISGEKVILKNIFYETDSYVLRPESTYELDKVVVFLSTNPNVSVEISGHTDNTGTAAYNEKLSENRARSVVEYLTSKGILKERLSARGYGMSEPVDTNETEEGRANNRRTELKIMD